MQTHVGSDKVRSASQRGVGNELIEHIDGHDVPGEAGGSEYDASGSDGSSDLSNGCSAGIDLFVANIDGVDTGPLAIEVADQLLKVCLDVANAVNASKYRQAMCRRRLRHNTHITADVVGPNMPVAIFFQESEILVDLVGRLALSCSVDHVVADAVTATGSTGGTRGGSRWSGDGWNVRSHIGIAGKDSWSRLAVSIWCSCRRRSSDFG